MANFTTIAPTIPRSFSAIQTSNWAHFVQNNIHLKHKQQKRPYDTIMRGKIQKMCDFWPKMDQKWPDFGNFKGP